MSPATTPSYHKPSTAERRLRSLCLIAAYYGGDHTTLRPQPKWGNGPDTTIPRLPLAWVALGPSARLIAERHAADDCVLMDNGGTTAQDASRSLIPLALATSTTPLSTVRQCLEMGKPCSSRSPWQLADVYLGSGRHWLKDEGQRETAMLPGTFVAGVYTVLISAAAMCSERGGACPKPDRDASSHHPEDSSPHHPAAPLRIWLNETYTDAASLALQAVLPDEAHHLFATTTADGDVLAMPEEVVFHTQPIAPASLPQRTADGTHGLSAGHRNKCKSARATLAASQLRHYIDGTSPDDAWYRQVYAEDEEAVTEGLLGVSQWWLTRPIAQRELPPISSHVEERGRASSAASESPVVAPIHVKLLADIFYQHWWATLCMEVLRIAYYIQVSLAGLLGLLVDPWQTMGLRRWWRSASLYWTTACADTFCAQRTVPHSALFLARCRHPMAAEDEASTTSSSGFLRGIALVPHCLGLALAVPLALLLYALRFLKWAMGAHSPLLSADCASDSVAGHLVAGGAGGAAQLRWLLELGRSYHLLLQAVDMSHTSVTGTHLLALSWGLCHDSTGVKSEGDHLGLPRGATLRALDLSGCTHLHESFRGLGDRTEVELWGALCRCGDIPNMPQLHTPVGGSQAEAARLLVHCLPVRSHVGRALSKLGGWGGLQLLHAAGSSIDDKALEEWGYCALFHEAVAEATSEGRSCPSSVPANGGCAGTIGATTEGNSLHPTDNSFHDTTTYRATLLAVQLTSCANVTRLFPLSYVCSILQVLAPFSGVSAADTSTATAVWGNADRIWADLCHVVHSMACDIQRKRLEKDAAALDRVCQRLCSCGSTTAGSILRDASPEAGVAGLTKQVELCPSRTDITLTETLSLRCRTHLYHLDLTFCTGVSSLRGLVKGQRALQYINVSLTRLTNTGLGAGLGENQVVRGHHGEDSCAPPLRVLIAQNCYHVTNLHALLTYHSTIERLHIRSGCLSTDGLLCFAKAAQRNADGRHFFDRLWLVDLCYCDKVEDVSVLACLPSLDTLLLDNTEIRRSGILDLRHCPSLRTLSLRFCPDFAAVGPDRARLERMVVPLPQVTRYVYEDLAGDECMRE